MEKIAALRITCPPENQSSINVRLEIKKGGYFIGQKSVQAGANHQVILCC